MINKIKLQIEALESIYQNISEDKLSQLCEDSLLNQKKGNKIIASGLGKNVPICEKFVGTMNSLGMNANFLNTNTAVHGDLGIIKNGDLVFVLTKSGETEESKVLVKELKKRSVKIWLLTFNQNSSLIDKVDNYLVMNIPNEGDSWDLVPNNSSLGYLLLLQALSMKLCDELNIPIETFKLNHPGGDIGRRLK